MGKPYANELAVLGQSFDWANDVGLGVASRFALQSYGTPLVAVGSGGSSTAAHFAALLHRHYSAASARHATPLETLLAEPTLHRSAVLLLSASGKNRDVLAAARAAINVEVPVLGSITMTPDNPLTREVEGYCRGFAFSAEIPSGKDGFLATNSLLGTLLILARAYGVEVTSVGVRPSLPDPQEIRSCRSGLVLHAAWSSPIATDLESRLHESTLLNVQVSDYRNFGHGRHLCLAHPPGEVAVVALVTPETEQLADRTLSVLPPDIPTVRLSSDSRGPSACIDLLVKVLHWTGALAKLRSIDPGRPRVPEFGRRLFHLTPPTRQQAACPPPVQRKLLRLGSIDKTKLRVYDQAYRLFSHTLEEAEFGALVLDYDGTLSPTDQRFGPLPEAVAQACIRVLRMGILLGIATGRGKSVRHSLQAALPSALWSSVLIGYYNGSDMAPLGDDSAPDKARPTEPAVANFSRVLAKDPLIHDFATVETRPSQITVSPRRALSPSDLYTYVLDLWVSASSPLHLLRSGHSVDFVAPQVSKVRVVQRLTHQVEPKAVLCIGDQGVWPGNDCRLLSHPYSLSVDKVSSALYSCWNLAPAGTLGPPATLTYLRALHGANGSARLLLDRLTK